MKYECRKNCFNEKLWNGFTKSALKITNGLVLDKPKGLGNF